MREHIRPTLQLLNAIGGGIVLDCLTSDEISEIMIENIEKIIQGDVAVIENNNDDYIDEEVDDVSNNSEEELYVSLGCKVYAVNIETMESKIYKAEYVNGTMHPVIKNILGMKKGDIFKVGSNSMKIKSIDFN